MAGRCTKGESGEVQCECRPEVLHILVFTAEFFRLLRLLGIFHNYMSGRKGQREVGWGLKTL